MSLEDWLHPLLAAYTHSPQWVKSTIGEAYARVPPTLRFGRHFGRFRDEVARCHIPEGLSRAADDKLLHTLRHALTHVPAYANHRSLLDQPLSPRELLCQLPLVSKEDIKANLPSYLSAHHPPHSRLQMFTGGSTANPMLFFAHKSITRPKENAYFEDFDQRAGLSSGDVILNLRGRNVRGAGKPGKRMWLYEPIKRHLILSSDHLEARFMPHYVDALRRWKPSFIHAFPSALYPLARWLEKRPAPDIVERIRGVELTSEITYPFQLDLFRKVFPCPVLRGYGHTERVLLAATMPDDDRYFFWPLYGHLELVDERGTSITEPGVIGEIVGTSFDNEVMPFVRYRTGDLGAWSAQPHPRLQGWPVLERIEGRLQEFVVCTDERLISVTTLGAAHFSDLAAARAIQYEQREPGRLMLKVVSDQDLDPTQRQTIAHAVRSKTQGGCEVDVVRVPHIERTVRGKHRMLVQHLDISGYFGAAYTEASA